LNSNVSAYDLLVESRTTHPCGITACGPAVAALLSPLSLAELPVQSTP
jgi:hypothetical protein